MRCWYHSKRLKIWYEKYMVIIGSLGQMLFYCQAYKIYTTNSAQDISLPGFLIAFLSLLSWLFYGIILHNRVLILVNVAGCFGAALVIGLKLWTDHSFN